ncbi:MAG: serine/threonine-protein kinase [Vicinamibacterales bacterium]
MTDAQRRRVRDLFEAAFDRPSPDDAAAWLGREAADDPVVRDEVLSLFGHHSRAGAFLSEPIAARLPDLLEDDEPLAPGARVGGYTIVRELGRGGMGRVYLATDSALGRQVALKALPPSRVGDPGQRERLRREARAAATLTHPGICTVYALEEVDGVLYLASEFVDGRTLGDEIRSGKRPSAADILRTAQELAGALASAHAAGVVHRDLKPDNLMRTREGRLKILDFGLARIVHAVDASPRVTQPGVILGTPAYMAPEQVNGETVGAPADVFAFGVTLYEYAAGVHPFAAPTTIATIARVLETEPPTLTSRAPDVPGPVADVIAHCLRKAPGERFGSAGELMAALEAAAISSNSVQPARAVWWRTHQLAIVAVYIVAATWAWQLKEWVETPGTLAIFLALGAAATIAGVLRGHLVFTDWMNPSRLTRERRRTGGTTRLLDLLTAALLFADAAMVAGTRALPAVFAIALALGIALASLVLEPATTAAVFGEEP